jgi:hypothetical protein
MACAFINKEEIALIGGGTACYWNNLVANSDKMMIFNVKSKSLTNGASLPR